MASDPPDRTSATQAALLDYYGAPGKHQLSLRQPAILFSSVREVLQLAARSGGDGKQAHVRDAANFFIRAAMLFPGADHYAVFGLESRSEPVELKERYRLLMRLIHPDYAAGQWPADAAIRVNQAYEVLSSPVLRRAYDEQLGGSKPQRSRPAVPVSGAEEQRSRRQRLAWAAACGAGASFLLGGLLIFAPDREPRGLVQRKPVQPPPTQAAPAVRVEALAGAAPLERPVAAPAIEAGTQPMMAATTQARPAFSVTAPPPADPRTPPHRAVQAKGDVAAVPSVPAYPVPPPALQPPATALPSTTVAAAAMPSPHAGLERPAPMPQAGRPAASGVLRTSALPAVPLQAPALTEVQPLLSQVLEVLESGQGERLLALLEPGARSHPSAQALSRHYNDLVGGARPVHVAHGEFRSEAEDGVLRVTSLLRLHVGEPTIASVGQRFVIKAEFTSRGGKVHLTGLSGVPQ